jgi:hypothetical protein
MKSVVTSARSALSARAPTAGSVSAQPSGDREAVQLFSIHQPKATLGSFHTFWRSMTSSSGEANAFFGALIKHLTHADGKPSKPGASEAVLISNGSVLATLLLLILYAPVNPESKELKRRLQERSRGSRAPERPDAPLSFDALLGMIGKAGDAGELAMMVQRCCDVTVADQYSSPHELIEGGEIASAFLFSYLLRRLQESHGTATVISTLRGLLSLGPSLISRPKALALLHMLREMLRACHQFTDEELGKLEKEVRVYRTWSMPVGAAACDTLQALTAELAMRGSSMFHVLQREAPWLRRGCPFVDAPRARRVLVDSFAVHTVVDEQVDWGRAFKALLMQPAMQHEEEECVRLALCSMLYALIKAAALGIAPAKIAALSFEQVVRFAAEASSLADRVGTNGADSVAGRDERRHSSDEREAAFEGLRALADKINSKSQRRPTEGGGVAGANDLRTARLPPLTLRPLERVAGSPQMLTELRESAEQCGGRRYMYDPLLMALHEKLRERAASGEPPELSPPLRICVAGGDGTLHRLIQAYVVLRCAYPRLCSPDALSFFVVPISSSKHHSHRLASFIASQDGWYRRHIFAPNYAGPPIVPHLIAPGGTHSQRSYLSGDTPDISEEPEELGHEDAGGRGSASMLPAGPLRACVTELLRSATAVLPIKLFEVACWLSHPPASSSLSGDGAASSSAMRPSEAPFLTVAVGQSIEVVSAAAQPGAAASEAGGGGVSVGVSYTMADPWGVSYPTSTRIKARFSALSFHTHCVAPFHSPSSGRLQMECRVASTSAGKAQPSPLRYVKAATISSGRDGVQDGLPSSRLQRNPGAAGGNSGAERFGLLVDGEYYGPFSHAQIAPCVVPGTSQVLTMPICTFFPIESDGADSM